MGLAESKAVFSQIAPSGYYVALRLGFFAPAEQLNEFPEPWITHYTVCGLAIRDPLMRWAYASEGAVRWSALSLEDAADVMQAYRQFGMPYGAAVAITDDQLHHNRSFGFFARADRELSSAELETLEETLFSLHWESADFEALTNAQTEALRLLAEGMRQKQIAYRLGISESAVKARLKSAMLRMDAKTAVQAASIAASKGLL